MATKTISTRIKNRFDSLTAWSAEGVTLLPGEIALVQVNTAKTDDNGNIIQVPAVLMKVGDVYPTGHAEAGKSIPFSELPWLSAIAADVYDWAKHANATDIPVTVGATSSTLGAYLTKVNTNVSDISANKNDIATLKGTGTGSVAKAVSEAITKLAFSPSGSGSYVTGVTMTDGVVTVTKGNLPAASDSTAGIAKLGAAGGAAAHNDVFGTDAESIASRITKTESDIAALGNAMAGGVTFRGTAAAEPTTIRKITLASPSKTLVAEVGDVVLFGEKEFICTDIVEESETIKADDENTATWVELGDLSRLGTLETAFKAMNESTTNDVTSTHEFASQVTQKDGKISVSYERPIAGDVLYDTNSKDTVKTKIDGLAADVASHSHAAYVNQNAFNIIKVVNSGNQGSAVNVVAASATDKVEFIGSNGITITGYNETDKRKVAFTAANASTSGKGVVQLGDKIKEDDSTATTTAATVSLVKTVNDSLKDTQGDVSAIESGYIHVGTSNNKDCLYAGKGGTDIIIFDCGGAGAL